VVLLKFGQSNGKIQPIMTKFEIDRKHQVRKAVRRRNSLILELQLLSAIFLGGLVVIAMLISYAFVDEIWKDLDFHPMSGMVLLVISSAGVLILNRKR